MPTHPLVTPSTTTGVHLLIDALVARGVRRIFGVPGGDCSLDVIDVASRRGIGFVLARNEDGAAIMAAVHAELTGSLGVVLTTRGPGIANAVNGIAYALLDRAPLVLIADGWEDNEGYISYQRLDQMELLAPLTRGALRLNSPASFDGLSALLDLALAEPMGPVYLEVTGSGLRSRHHDSHDSVPEPHFHQSAQSVPEPHSNPSVGSVPESTESYSTPTRRASSCSGAQIAAKSAIEAARRPVVIAGLQARNTQVSTALRDLVHRLQCPVFTTWKAKGAVADEDPLVVGHFLGGPGEGPIFSAADLIIAIGTDPIEFAPKPWAHPTPVVELLTHHVARRYFVADVALTGDIAEALAAITPAGRASAWRPEDIAEAKAELCRRALLGVDAGEISPQLLIEATRAAAPGAVITVDSGAHMLAVMALCHASRPRQVLISKGLATMAFALPAAIGASLADPMQRVVAFIGDGGLMMCAGELATAAQYRCNLTVVVFNDSSLSLIAVKQRRRNFPAAGVDCALADFAAVARGFGCRGYRVEDRKSLASTLDEAMSGEGPVVIDVVIDPAAYHLHIAALRG